MSDQETQAIERGIEAATHPDGPWEWGHYIERFDGGDNGDRSDDSLWTPLIYGEMTEDGARELHDRDRYQGSRKSDPYRRSRVVRRAVSPWEVQR